VPKIFPPPVDDSVLGVYRDRFLYLIGGWSKTEPTRKVQVYDAEKNKWTEATPLPRYPRFSDHSGAIVGDTIVYIDGAYKNPSGANPKYLASSECWIGKITKGDIAKIEWTKLPDHPAQPAIGSPLALPTKDGKIYFSGGTDNPYNYNGIGYNGQPSEPSPVTFAFNVKAPSGKQSMTTPPILSWTFAGLLVTHRGLLLVGGMIKGQQVDA